MSASDHRPPSAYIPFRDLPQAYDALQARYDVLLREYLTLSSEAAHLKRKLTRYLASDWITVRAHPEPQHTEHQATDLGDRNDHESR